MDTSSRGSTTDTWLDSSACILRVGRRQKEQKACLPGIRLFELFLEQGKPYLYILIFRAQDLGLLWVYAGNEE